MDVLEEYRHRRKTEETNDEACSRSECRRVRRPASVTLYDMVDPIANAVRRSPLFIAGCSLSSRNTSNSTTNRNRYTQRKTLALPAPQANSVVFDSKPPAAPTVVGTGVNPAYTPSYAYMQRPSPSPLPSAQSLDLDRTPPPPPPTAVPTVAPPPAPPVATAALPPPPVAGGGD